MSPFMRLLLLILLSVASFSFTPRSDAGEIQILSGGVKYENIGVYDTDRLNSILTTEYANFSTFSVTYPKAKNAVKLYRVTYPTVVPEESNRPVQASGLIAIPEAASERPPLLSYQHGTVFSKDEVPSHPEKSMETRLMIAAFAAQGYVIIAADYIGRGASPEPNSYLVKEATAQACYDMLRASRLVLKDLGLQSGDLFLNGWSQGSFSTLVFLNRLETLGEPVKAAGFASAPSDLYLCMTRWIYAPSELDVQWLLGAATLLIHSYEEYCNLPGLSKIAFRPEYQQTAQDLYENKISWEEASKVFPQKTRDLLQDDFVNQATAVDNRFFRALQDNRAYEWRFKTPTQFYYGKVDEVIPPYVAALPVDYQKTINEASSASVFAGEDANHRGTFAFSVKDLQTWFGKMSGIAP